MHTFRKAYILFFMSLLLTKALLSSTANGMELKPIVSKKHLGASITQIPLSQKDIKKELRSGFTSTYLYQIKISRLGAGARQVNKVVRINYDLWDEIYQIRTIKDGKQRTQTVKSQEAVLNLLSQWKVRKIFPIDEISSRHKYTIEGAVLFNPLSKDKLDKIKNWVEGNNNTAGDQVGLGARKKGQLNKLFFSIFNQYLDSGKNVGVWKDTEKLDSVIPVQWGKKTR